MLLLLWSGAGHFHGITDTDILQLPIDCVLAGNQPYKERVSEYDVPPHNQTERIAIGRSGVKNLKGQPSYTVKSGPLNKSH